MRFLIEGTRIWDGAEGVIDDGAILIDGETIEAVLPSESSREVPFPVERIDGRGKLAIPGLVNAHAHLYSSLARGMSVPGFSPSSFTQILEQLWWRLDKALDVDSVRTSALVGAMEAARCGVTTLIDHHASPHAIPGSLDAVHDAVCEKVGLRAALCYEVSDRDGLARRDEGIGENLRFIDSIAPENRRCAASFGLHASFTLSDETLGRVAEQLPEDAGVHIHVAEGPEDETQCVAEHGMRVVERLDRFGLLRQNSILVHCLHLDKEEKDLVAERDAIVVHNPRSNMNNAVGTFDLTGFLSRNVLTGLGTDGLGANMLGELFTAGLLQKHSQADPLAAPFSALQRLLFNNNTDIVERLFGIKVGGIAPGCPADIALVDYTPPTPLAADSLLGHLLFGISVHTLRVSDLLVAGRLILRDGWFVDLDEEAIYAHAREQAKALWERIA